MEETARSDRADRLSAVSPLNDVFLATGPGVSKRIFSNSDLLHSPLTTIDIRPLVY
jgi:hypothetical protein